MCIYSFAPLPAELLPLELCYWLCPHPSHCVSRCALPFLVARQGKGFCSLSAVLAVCRQRQGQASQAAATLLLLPLLKPLGISHHAGAYPTEPCAKTVSSVTKKLCVFCC